MGLKFAKVVNRKYVITVRGQNNLRQEIVGLDQTVVKQGVAKSCMLHFQLRIDPFCLESFHWKLIRQKGSVLKPIVLRTAKTIEAGAFLYE